MIDSLTSSVDARAAIAQCPVCAATESFEWGIRTGHTMYECQSCGLVFFERGQFELHEYQNYYDYTETWDKARMDWEIKIRRRAFRTQFDRLGRYVAGRKHLDIGAGLGFLCSVAAEEGWESQGVELSPTAVGVGRKFLNIDYVQLDDVASGSLDLITCYHVLEHMERPDEFIQLLHSKLRPNGVVAVHVPHREPLSFLFRNRLMAWRGAEEVDKNCQLYVPEHISGFTSDSLAKAFSLFGFQTLMIRTSSMWSSYNDPFFLKNYLRENNYQGICKHAIRCIIDNVGVLLGQGDWVIGHFRKV